MSFIFHQQPKQVFNGGLKWDLELLKRLDNPHCLENYGYQVYSQNDEDGIIQEIFKRIGTTNRRFIEFGVQNGLQCNSHYLLHKNWSGLWIEGSLSYFKQIQTLFKSPIANNLLKVVNTFITRDNINEIFADAGFCGEIDLLSIDIDGNDYHIWESIRVINPRAVIIEYNAKFPSDCEWIMPYKADYIWDGSDKQGASLKSLELLGRIKGYSLVGTNLNGVNAFFIRSDLVHNLFSPPYTSENLYNPPRWNYQWQTGHPANSYLDNDNNCTRKLHRSEIVGNNIKTAIENIKSREFLIWGTGDGFKYVRLILKSYNIEDYVCYDSNRTNYHRLNEDFVLSDLSSLTVDKYYVIITTLQYHGEIDADLQRRGFCINNDYIFVNL